MKISRFTVDICQGCLDLEGEMCCTPECFLCFYTTGEIKKFLNLALIRLSCNNEMVQEPILTYEAEDD